MRTTKIVVTMAMLLGFAVAAQAGVVPIVNGDFEDTSSVYPYGKPVGWTTNTVGIGVFTEPVSGRSACIFNQTGKVGNPPSYNQVMYQYVNHQIVAGATYDFSVDICNGPAIAESTGLPLWNSFGVQWWADNQGVKTWLGGGTFTPADFSSPSEWKTLNYQYVDNGTNAGSIFFVQFQILGGIQTYLDDVQIMETIPEPATLTLLGVCGLLGVRRKKQ